MRTRQLATTRPLVLIIAVAVMVLNCSCTKGPNGLSADTYKGIQKTLSAMRRANEYRDSGVLLFEPRFLELEAQADSIVTRNDADERAASIVRECVEGFRLYRKSQDIYLDYLENRQALPKAPKALTGLAATLARSRRLKQESDDFSEKKMMDDARENVDACLVTLGGYLQTAARRPSKKGRVFPEAMDATIARLESVAILTHLT